MTAGVTGIGGWQDRRTTAGRLLGVCAGNALEFYEFLIYSTFAVYIGTTFFPPNAPGGTLLPSLATFGAGFLTRPIGGWAIGRLADRAGRKVALLVSLGLMAVGMAGLALTPGYARIGIAAPILLLLFRLIQGFALGGEVGPATAYLVESAEDGRRGFNASMQGGTQGMAMLAAALAGFLLSLVLPTAALQAWGWRLALLPGLLVIPVALQMRRHLPETLHAARADPPASRSSDLRLILCGLLVIGSSTIGTYLGTYTTTYALTTLHLPTRVSFAAGLTTGLVILIMSPIAGHLSDRLGRKPVLIFGLAGAMLVTIPAFWLIVHFPSALTLFTMTTLVGIVSVPAAAPIMTMLTEGFPPHRRSTAFCCIYASSIAVFGGTTQFVITWLIERTGDPMMPAYYRAGAAAIGLCAGLAMFETAPIRLARKAAIGAALPV